MGILTQDTRLSQQHTVDNFVCLECFQERAVAQKLVVKDGKVVCPLDPTHERHVREGTVLAKLRRQQREARMVIKNYPQLNPHPLDETFEQSMASLGF